MKCWFRLRGLQCPNNCDLASLTSVDPVLERQNREENPGAYPQPNSGGWWAHEATRWEVAPSTIPRVNVQQHQGTEDQRPRVYVERSATDGAVTFTFRFARVQCSESVDELTLARIRRTPENIGLLIEGLVDRAGRDLAVPTRYRQRMYEDTVITFAAFMNQPRPTTAELRGAVSPTGRGVVTGRFRVFVSQQIPREGSDEEWLGIQWPLTPDTG